MKHMFSLNAPKIYKLSISGVILIIAAIIAQPVQAEDCTSLGISGDNDCYLSSWDGSPICICPGAIHKGTYSKTVKSKHSKSKNQQK